MTGKKGKHRQPMFLVAEEDCPLLKEDLKLFDEKTKKSLKFIASVRKLATFNPPELSKLPPEELASFQSLKRDGMVTDIAYILEFLTHAQRLAAEYALKSAYAQQHLRQRLVSLE